MKESALPGRSAADPYGTIPSPAPEPRTSGLAETVSFAGGLPKAIARYRIERILGQGGFGLVYLAHDDQLQRLVAIKVPHRDRISGAEDADAYLTEARTVASLDHPHIVPVFDVGGTEEFPCFVVSKYIDGTDLATKLKHFRLSIHETVELVSTVAEALHYAHRKGLVHRDIKPANILIDTDNKPYVADFGLALKEEDFGRGASFAGTPAYMSPEQARGEGHRVDGRSDIFSLGVVLYELLTGRRPFKADSQAELLEQISSVDVRPPRQVDDAIPKELERICLKTLSKRASERYTTAKDLADDLRHFFAEATDAEKSTLSVKPASDTAAVPTPVPTGTEVAPSDSRPIKIVPKGLRSFDAHDADFFLELLPGPRDRDGLPDSLRFWKTRIEETDADNTFSVGLIYGPSGCGKSSLVKAGLLPRLSDDVIAVYVEATAEETETRLLNGLRKRCPNLPNDLSLKDTMAALRRGQGIPVGTKVLIVLDQFEQWLHAKKEEQDTELVQALRQCDGQHVQCVVMVRDDFWMAVTRFLTYLEIELLQGRNCASADLFDLDHARKVLAAFGRAFGKLPENSGDTSKDQKEFLNQAVSGLAQEGKVICVRLALFAEMMKGKLWTPATLKDVGGTEGVGLTFLEETFAASTAPPQHRLHQKATQSVLKALLPDVGTDIKGHMRSHSELLIASGYGSRPKDFDALVRILDSEIRLITPTDPEGKEGAEESAVQTQSGQKYYQLTHDYLVPSLRDWLTRKQRETRKGRAELLLADRAAVWNARPESRQLPSLLQWFNILWWTPRKDWTQPQQKMMRAAGRVHGIQSGIAAMVLLAVVISGVAIRNAVLADRATTLVDALTVAPPQAVPYAIQNLKPVQGHSLPILRQRLAEESRDPSQRLHAAVALAHFGEVDVPFLVASIPQAQAGEYANIIGALRRDPTAAIASLKAQFKSTSLKAQFETTTQPNRRFRLAVVLLQFGEVKPSQQLLALALDPSQRTLFIHDLHEWRGDLADYAKLLSETDDPDFQSGLCQAFGQIPATELTAHERKALEPVLKNLSANSPYGSTHSAARWAMQHWKLDVPKPVVAEPAKPEREWYVNPLGMTFLKIPAGCFDRHAEARGGETTMVTLSRAFWLGDCEVTRKQFDAFVTDPDCPPAENPMGWKIDERASPTADHPVNRVSWFDAVLFCNWLSRRERLRPYYERTGKKQKNPFDSKDEWDVWRSVPKSEGYRLPTEAEWEYACRAKSATKYYFGYDESLLGHYASYITDETQPVSSRQPNGWGLFDMHGNVWEWNEDWYLQRESNLYQLIIDPAGPSTGNNRVLRGGGFNNPASNLRSAFRHIHVPTHRYFNVGFRAARTLPPVPLTPLPPPAEGGSRK